MAGMSEMLERVKVAIFVSADDAHNTWPTPDHPECVKMARAVLEAMRKPTAYMTLVGAECHGLINYGATEKAWEAMIDMALRDDLDGR